MRSNYLLKSSMLLLMLSSMDLALADGPTDAQSLDDWMNAQIASAVLTRLDLRQGTRQTEAPSRLASSTSLVDKSSASALMGMGLNLAGLSTGANEDSKADSVSVTSSAYAFLAAATGNDALNPSFYNAHPGWRRLYVTLGYDKPQNGNSTGAESANVVGLKYLVLNRRDPSLYTKEAKALAELAAPAGFDFGNLRSLIFSIIQTDPSVASSMLRPLIGEQLLALKMGGALGPETLEMVDTLLNSPEPESAITYDEHGNPDTPADTPSEVKGALFKAISAFEDSYCGAGQLSVTWERLTDASRSRILERVPKASIAYEELEAQTRVIVRKMQQAPQLSISALTKRTPGGPDDFSLEVIFDYGLDDRVDFTANASYLYTDSQVVGADKRGGSAAVNFDFVPGAIHLLQGKDPMKLSLSGMGNWMSDSNAEYKAQLKLTLPISDGISFPISATYASRTADVDEQTVRGQFGFAFDVARLMSALSKH